MTKASSMSKDGLIVARFSLAAENEGLGQSIRRRLRRRCGDSDLDLNELHLGGDVFAVASINVSTSRLCFTEVTASRSRIRRWAGRGPRPAGQSRLTSRDTHSATSDYIFARSRLPTLWQPLLDSRPPDRVKISINIEND